MLQPPLRWLLFFGSPHIPTGAFPAAKSAREVPQRRNINFYSKSHQNPKRPAHWHQNAETSRTQWIGMVNAIWQSSACSALQRSAIQRMRQPELSVIQRMQRL
jgi:hypothetical protein